MTALNQQLCIGAQVNGVITPNADNVSSLGNATYRWSSVFAANGTIQTSDQRLKSNITDLNYGLSDILKLHPVSFTWTAQPHQGTQLGFIAQEVQLLFPETGNVGDDANHTLGCVSAWNKGSDAISMILTAA